MQNCFNHASQILNVCKQVDEKVKQLTKVGIQHTDSRALYAAGKMELDS